MANPNGIESFSPGLPRESRATLGYMQITASTLKGLNSRLRFRMKRRQFLRHCEIEFAERYVWD